MNAPQLGKPRIRLITACTIQGEKRDFANIYGIDEESCVWQWDVVRGGWRPAVIPGDSERRDRGRRR